MRILGKAPILARPWTHFGHSYSTGYLLSPWVSSLRRPRFPVAFQIPSWYSLPRRHESDPWRELMLAEAPDGFAGNPGRGLAHLEVDGRVGDSDLRIGLETSVHLLPALIVKHLVLVPTDGDDPAADFDSRGGRGIRAARHRGDGQEDRVSSAMG